MRQLFRFVAVLAGLGCLAVTQPLAAQFSGGGSGPCQMMTMADGSKVQMCKDAQGNWVQQQGQPASSASTTGFPRRAEAVWQGTYDITVSKPGRVKNLSLGGLLNAATSGQSQRYTGRIEYRATITGDQVVVQLSGSNFPPEELIGTLRGGICHFENHNGKIDITHEGRCDAKTFTGKINGKDSRGNNQKGTFTTTTVQLTDLDLRDRQQAAQRAENERQAAAQRTENERKAKAAAAELAAKPNASAAQARALESAVAQDSQSWAFNRYQPGSMRNVKVLNSGPTTRLRGEYTYNGSQTGWVEAELSGNRVNCLNFWDVGSCSTVRPVAYNANRSEQTNVQSVKNGQVVRLASFRWYRAAYSEARVRGNDSQFLRVFISVANIRRDSNGYVKYYEIQVGADEEGLYKNWTPMVSEEEVNCSNYSVRALFGGHVEKGVARLSGEFVNDPFKTTRSASLGRQALEHICSGQGLVPVMDPVQAGIRYVQTGQI